MGWTVLKTVAQNLSSGLIHRREILAWLRSLTLLSVMTVKNPKNLKFRDGDSRHLENRKVATSRQRFDRSVRNLAH